jgi:type II secretory pathway component PulC
MNIHDILTNIYFSPRGMVGINIICVVIFVSTLFYASWQWHHDWQLKQKIVTLPASAKTDEWTAMISAIPNNHLFGQAVSTTSSMPISNLQLRVTGIVKVNTEQGGIFSKAYISISGQPSKIYRVGENLPYGVKVYDITPDTIILENDGHFEKLPLPRETLKFKSKSTEELLINDSNFSN